ALAAVEASARCDRSRPRTRARRLARGDHGLAPCPTCGEEAGRPSLGHPHRICPAPTYGYGLFSRWFSANRDRRKSECGIRGSLLCPSTTRSAINRPTAGAILNPCPLKPAATTRPSNPVVEITGFQSGVTS